MRAARWCAAPLIAALTPGAVAAQTGSAPQTGLGNGDAAVAQPTAADRPPRLAPLDPRLSDDSLLLFEVGLDQLTLADSMATYTTARGPLIPLGELCRLLMVDVTTSPVERRIAGNVGEARRPILVDVANRLVRIDGTVTALDREDAAVGVTDIYVSPALLERLLPVAVTVDQAALRLVLKPLQPLPVQSRLDRLNRLRGLPASVVDHDDVLLASSPYRVFSAPAFDVSLAAATDTRRTGPSSRYDIRAAGDLLYTGFQGYLGSDDKGRPSTARATFERRDPSGMFGPLDITRAAAGDVFTPSLPIGPRSLGGRGIALTTAPLAQASVFDRIDLRGELPIGYDIELYVNDVLRGGQQAPVQGRYEFLNVALVRGVNVIRLVTYGPHGERSEETRVVNVGDGQLAKGKLVVDVGAVQQDRNLIPIGFGTTGALVVPGRGRLRLTTDLAYGLTSRLTVTAGFASYAPTGMDERQIVSLGLRTSFLGVAPQLDIARDSIGGDAIAIGVAGRPLGIATILRHAEYRGVFIDETVPNGGDGRALVRHSEATVDLAMRPFGMAPVPIAASVRRDQYVDGGSNLSGAVRASAVAGRALLSAGLDYDSIAAPHAAPVSRLSGAIAASTFAAYHWQLRASIDYQIRPDARLRALTLSADRNTGRNTALRLGLAHSFDTDKSSTAQASALFRLPIADLSFDGDYEVKRGDWRLGLTLAFSLSRDPLRRRYRVGRIGAASGGNLAVQAFVDANGNGVLDTGETPVPGVAIDGGAARAVTDARGAALLTGLGYAAAARVQTNIDQVDIPYVAAPPSTIEFTPRPGRTTVVMYPLQPQGEVSVRLMMRRDGAKPVGVSAVQLRLVADAGTVIEAATEYDGSVVFERLKAGRYRLELDADQAARLGMRLATPIAFAVPAKGGVLPDVRGEVVFTAK